jgi:thymidylate synthase (FAD)
MTQPLINDENGQKMTANDFIAYCARVSNPSNQMNSLTAPKLLRYCASHNHWSIFEQVDINMEINTTRDIGRQILRHRSFSFQEFSQRYADPTTDLGFSMRDARLQDTKNRQNSIEISPAESESAANLINDWEAYQSVVLDEARIAYVWAIQNGIAKEQARAVLPEGLTMSRMYMKGSLRSWITYIAIREKVETQKEHREIAKACKLEILQLFPSLSYLSNENDEWVV